MNELAEKVRDLSLNLRPSMLDDMGLLPALLWLVQRCSSQAGLEVRFEHSGVGGRLAPDVETAAYRVAQEALTNVARHAATGTATLAVRVTDGVLELSIEDEGVGFDSDDPFASTSSVGLPGMRERVELLGGDMALESAPGSGTRLKVRLPLNATAS